MSLTTAQVPAPSVEPRAQASGDNVAQGTPEPVDWRATVSPWGRRSGRGSTTTSAPTPATRGGAPRRVGRVGGAPAARGAGGGGGGGGNKLSPPPRGGRPPPGPPGGRGGARPPPGPPPASTTAWWAAWWPRRPSSSRWF